MIFSVLIQDLEPVPSRPPRSNERMRTHVVEANDFGHFFSPGVEDPVSNTDCLPAILCIENLSRAGRVRKNSKCCQCRQPRLNHIYQSHGESYTYTVLLCHYVVLSDHCHHCVITNESNCAVGWNSYMYNYAEWHNALPMCLIFLCHYNNIRILTTDSECKTSTSAPRKYPTDLQQHIGRLCK